MRRTIRVMIPRSHHAFHFPLPIFDACPDPSRNILRLAEVRQAMPLAPSMFRGPPAACRGCGAALQIATTIFRPEDSDWAPWPFCYSCGAGLMMHFGWYTLDDIAEIPYYGGGPQVELPPVRPS